MIRINNATESGFHDYLLNNGYARTTCADYIHRLRNIKPLDQLIDEDLDDYICEYENGSLKDFNNKKHKAPSSALKRFKEFKNTLITP